MFANYFFVALRNARRHRLYSFITIAGMMVALTCAIFIMLFIADELSYDQWIPDSQNLYRVEIGLTLPGSPPIITTNCPFPLGPAMKAKLPEVTAQTHLYLEPDTVRLDNRQFSEEVDVVDSNFFQIIRLPLVRGQAANVFSQPNSVVISQKIARKYFGTSDPIGRILTINALHPMTVTGVLRNLPHNTQLSGDIFIPNTSKADQMGQDSKAFWFALDGFTYVRLAPGAHVGKLRAEAKAIFTSHFSANTLNSLHETADHIAHLHLVPFRSVHLESDKYGGMTPGGSWTEIYGFSAISALILAIAAFNFMNLATARAMMRAREVSLRKVLGARRSQLIAQFLGESVGISLFSLVLAMAAVELLLPRYDALLGRPIALHYFVDWPLTLSAFGITLLVGLLGGLYPAFVLSGFRPAATLRPSTSRLSGSGFLRTILVTFQFAISIGLGIAVMVIFRQITYAQDVDYGFNRDNIVVLDASNASFNPTTAESFMRTLARDPSILGAAQSNAVPFEADENNSFVTKPGNPQHLAMRMIELSPSFAKVYGMHMLAGRFLSHGRAQDESRNANTADGIDANTNVVIDQLAARELGFTPQAAIGKTIKIDSKDVTIVGVVQTALFHGVQETPNRIIYFYNPTQLSRFSVRVKGNHIHAALTAIDHAWHQFAPNVAVQRHFLNSSFNNLFLADQQNGKMFGLFVGIAIFIASLGLFGLAAFTAERRTKEIGIRKVFGARTRAIVRLLLWQFSRPVLIANLIAWPITWYYLQEWLERYAYRIDLNPLYFLTAGFIALVIAWGTVIGHAVRVARSNPVRALRYE